jgi:serine/threonine protein kinase
MSGVKINGLKQHFFSSHLFKPSSVKSSDRVLASLFRRFGKTGDITLSPQSIRAIVTILIGKIKSPKPKDADFKSPEFLRLFVQILATEPFSTTVFASKGLATKLPYQIFTYLGDSSSLTNDQTLAVARLLKKPNRDSAHNIAFSKFTDHLSREKLLFLVTLLESYDSQSVYAKLSDDTLKMLLLDGRFKEKAFQNNLGIGRMVHRRMALPGMGGDAHTEPVRLPLLDLIIKNEKFPEHAHLSLSENPKSTLSLSTPYVIYPHSPGKYRISVFCDGGAPITRDLNFEEGWKIDGKPLSEAIKYPKQILPPPRKKVTLKEEPTKEPNSVQATTINTPNGLVIEDAQGHSTRVKSGKPLGAGGFGLVRKAKVSQTTEIPVKKVVKKMELVTLPEITVGSYSYEIRGNKLILNAPPDEVKSQLVCKDAPQDPDRTAAEAQLIERIRKEAEFGQKLDHPYIGKTHLLSEPYEGLLHVTLTDEEGNSKRYKLYAQGPNGETVPVTGTKMAMVQDRIRGNDLSSIVDSKKEQPSTANKIKWFFQILTAVAYMHDQGIVHKDLKLQNVMITNSGRAKVIDFGLSQNITDPCRDSGSLGYAAPELFELAGLPPKVLDKDRATKLDAYSLASLALAMFFLEDMVRFIGMIPGQQGPYDMDILRTELDKKKDSKPKALQQLYPFLIKMGEVDPKKRMSVKDCIDAIQKDKTLGRLYQKALKQ